MSEPYIGMEFTTYQTMTDKLKNSQNAQWNLERESTYNFGEKDGGVYDEKNNTVEIQDGQQVIFNSTHIAVQRSNPKHARINAFIISEELMYVGATDNYQKGKDIMFTRIMGQKTYAVDKNGNGVVDEGEILKYPIPLGEERAEKDEEMFHINTCI